MPEIGCSLASYDAPVLPLADIDAVLAWARRSFQRYAEITAQAEMRRIERILRQDRRVTMPRHLRLASSPLGLFGGVVQAAAYRLVVNEPRKGRQYVAIAERLNFDAQINVVEGNRELLFIQSAGGQENRAPQQQARAR